MPNFKIPIQWKHFRYILSLTISVIALAVVSLTNFDEAKSAAQNPPAAIAITNTAMPFSTIVVPTPTLIVSDPGAALFSADQIWGGLQTTVTDIQWAKSSDVPSSDGQAEPGWTNVTIYLSVKCILKDGCPNISVMDYDLIYGKYVGVIIYGSQQEFAEINLKPEETTSGSITFAVPDNASSFALRYAPKPMVITEFSR